MARQPMSLRISPTTSFMRMRRPLPRQAIIRRRLWRTSAATRSGRERGWRRYRRRRPGRTSDRAREWCRGRRRHRRRDRCDRRRDGSGAARLLLRGGQLLLPLSFRELRGGRSALVLLKRLERDDISSPRSSLLFELRASALRLSRGKTGTHPSGRGPRAAFPDHALKFLQRPRPKRGDRASVFFDRIAR